MNWLIFFAATVAPASGSPDLTSETWYHQAVSCGASASVEQEGAQQRSDENAEELMTWGLVMTRYGSGAGRSEAQIQNEDLKAAESFYRMMRDAKPNAFAAHRIYCRALRP